MDKPLKILFKYPCRGRENMFFASLESLHNNIRDRENYHISITLDTDDEVLNRVAVTERIATYENTSIGWGLSSSKIDAINRSFPEYDFDVVVCWSNDMFATFFGFDDIFRQSIIDCCGEEMDGLVHFPEPDAREMLNTLYVATRKYYDRFGYIYHPSYKSLWCDNESLHVAQKLERYHYCNIPVLFIHKNPAYGHHNVMRDEMFDRQQADWQEDENNFRNRQLNNFDL